MRKTNGQKGITLVALVVTIIILLILAGISISSLTKTGIFQKANEAKQKSEEAEENQTKTLNEYENELNKYISGTPTTPPAPQVKKVADNIGSVLSTTDNTELKDAYGNKIVVPAGFKIVFDSTTSNAQTVDKGIVVEDATVDSEGKATATAGSQFVWIPVGKIYTDVAKTDANAKTIELNRYTFDSNGKPTAQGESIIELYCSEKASNGNAVAKNTNDFKTSVKQNMGYYIGRYEARQKSGKVTVVKNDNIWNNITQLNAAIQAGNMYDSTKTFTSDLMNSYAWDTAIIFIQNCTNKTEYSKQTSLNKTLLKNGTTNDVQCNIYDMASNIGEWTTETSSHSTNPCVRRGGNYYDNDFYTSTRNIFLVTSSSDLVGFRPILYVNVK